MKKYLFLACIFAAMPAYSQSLLSKIYCRFLGNVDVHSAYKKLVHTALKDFGIQQPEQVSVKQMNGVGPLIALNELVSFTAFGIWLNEEYLNAYTSQERMFQIYHEAAHYAQSHHQTFLGSLVTMLVFTGLTLLCIHKQHQKSTQNCLTNIITITGALAAVPVIFRGVVPMLIQRREKEADILAAKKLIELGHRDVVEARIKLLQSIKLSNGNIWWYSEKDQAEYLEATLL